GGVLCLLQRAGGVGYLACFLGLDLLGLPLPLPRAIAANRLPLKRFGIGERAVCLPALLGQRPSAAALQEPSGLHGGDRGEADRLLVAPHARIAGIGFLLELARRHQLLDGLEHLRRGQPVWLVHKHVKYAPHEFPATPTRDLRHLSRLLHAHILPGVEIPGRTRLCSAVGVYRWPTETSVR